MEKTLKIIKSGPLLKAELTSELGQVAESLITWVLKILENEHSTAFPGYLFWDLFTLTNYCHISDANCELYPLAFPSPPHLLLIHLCMYICNIFVYILYLFTYLYINICILLAYSVLNIFPLLLHLTPSISLLPTCHTAKILKFFWHLQDLPTWHLPHVFCFTWLQKKKRAKKIEYL